MSTTMQVSTAGFGTSKLIRGVTARVLAGLHRWREERLRLRAMSELAQLDDAMLRDVCGSGELYNTVRWLRQPVVDPTRQW